MLIEEIEPITNLQNINADNLHQIVKNLIIELNLDLGRNQRDDIVTHTSMKFANYLHHNYKWLSLADMIDLFDNISYNKLGDIYAISFNSLCKYLSEYQKNKIEKNRKENPGTKINYDEKIKEIGTSFKTAFKKEPELKYRCPYIYSILIAGIIPRKGEKLSDFLKRGKNYNV